MDSNELSTFLLVARCHSFNRASQRLFITPAAVMKQVKKLEDYLGVPLFNRTHTGVTLTAAGQAMVPEAQRVLAAIKQARQKMAAFRPAKPVIRIGTSLINPATRFSALWAKLKKLFPNYQFIYVAMRDRVPRPYSDIGTNVDIVLGPFNLLNRRELLASPIANAHFTISMLAANPLSKRREITFNDLLPMHVYTVPAHVSEKIDQVRQKLQATGITLHNAGTGYSMDTFNRITAADDCLLSLDYWEQASPNIVSIPLATELLLPVDVIISRHAPQFVQDVYQAIIDLTGHSKNCKKPS